MVIERPSHSMTMLASLATLCFGSAWSVTFEQPATRGVTSHPFGFKNEPSTRLALAAGNRVRLSSLTSHPTALQEFQCV